MTKIKPATPLPWESETPMGGIRTMMQDGVNRHIYTHHQSGDFKARNNDAAYIAHACNSYPRLVEALREAREAFRWTAEKDGGLLYPHAEGAMTTADALLRELGEA